MCNDTSIIQNRFSAQDCAIAAAKAGNNILITGGAGTGKTFILLTIIDFLLKAGKVVLVCAPTGTAAMNIGGTTVHRAFSYTSTPAINLKTMKLKMLAPEKLCAADVIIIDEISMLRVDFFDSIIASIRKAEKKSGTHKQIILCGDPLQLPPFIDNGSRELFIRYYGADFDVPWFFLGKEWHRGDWRVINLEETYRQTDSEFVKNLNLARVGDISCIPYFNANAAKTKFDDAVWIVPNKKKAAEINRQCMSVLDPNTECTIAAIPSDGLTESDIKSMGIPQTITLREGCRVMTTANDNGIAAQSQNVIDALLDVPVWKRKKYQYCNGSMGTVELIKVNPDRHVDDSVVVRMDDNPNELIEIYRRDYPVYEYVVENEELIQKIVGIVSMIPVIPAYAITYHKAQGKTLEKVNLDPNNFGSAMLYTGLSRVKSISGLYLSRKIEESDLKANAEAIEFMENIDPDNYLFMPGKRGPKPQPVSLTHEKDGPGKGRPGLWGDMTDTKSVRVPVEIAEAIELMRAATYPKNDDDTPDDKYLKKLIKLCDAARKELAKGV